METTVQNSPRLRRMRGECARAAGQASVLGLALAVLVAALALAAVIG